jgi:hypothetical protein
LRRAQCASRKMNRLAVPGSAGRDILGIDIDSAPHLLAPRLEIILGQAPGRGSSRSEVSRPIFTKQRLVRQTVEPPTATVAAMTTSARPEK